MAERTRTERYVERIKKAVWSGLKPQDVPEFMKRLLEDIEHERGESGATQEGVRDVVSTINEAVLKLSGQVEKFEAAKSFVLERIRDSLCGFKSPAK